MGEGNNENNEGEAETRGFVRRRIHGQEPTYWVYDTTLIVCTHVCHLLKNGR